MTLRDRIALTWRYGKGIFLVGAVYNAVCAGVQAERFSYSFLIDAFLIKAAITAVTAYLLKQFSDRDAIFFYINLGLSRRKMLVSVVLADFLVLVLLMAFIYLIHG